MFPAKRPVARWYGDITFFEPSARCRERIDIPTAIPIGGIPVTEQSLHFKSMDIDFVHPFFHGHDVNFVLRVGEMSGIGGEAPAHLMIRNDAHASQPIDYIRTDEQLLRFPVDH